MVVVVWLKRRREFPVLLTPSFLLEHLKSNIFKCQQLLLNLIGKKPPYQASILLRHQF
jgi:hypothetical protein